MRQGLVALRPPAHRLKHLHGARGGCLSKEERGLSALFEWVAILNDQLLEEGSRLLGGSPRSDLKEASSDVDDVVAVGVEGGERDASDVLSSFLQPRLQCSPSVQVPVVVITREGRIERRQEANQLVDLPLRLIALRSRGWVGEFGASAGSEEDQDARPRVRTRTV